MKSLIFLFLIGSSFISCINLSSSAFEGRWTILSAQVDSALLFKDTIRSLDDMISLLSMNELNRGFIEISSNSISLLDDSAKVLSFFKINKAVRVNDQLVNLDLFYGDTAFLNLLTADSMVLDFNREVTYNLIKIK
ncbi:MAG TPA: hypothetical protein VLZ83_08015 [Edaphocola sp.]|nr:hypothetical protein [Edaphocola sp.]